MSNETRRTHWDTVYGTKRPSEVSWFQPSPALSLELVRATGLGPDAPIVDVGAGASTLVDGLLDAGFTDLTALDIAAPGLEASQQRLGAAAERVRWVVADVTRWRPERPYALWHDRAVFHFLTEAADREAYRRALRAGVRPGGHVILATFAPDGPERCSGLPVCRYGPGDLAAEFEGTLRLVEARAETHRTPWQSEQSFTYVRFERA